MQTQLDRPVPWFMKQSPPSAYKSHKAMDDHLQVPANRQELVGRSSFSSIREDDSSLAQTFTLSKVSSYSAAKDSAIEDGEPVAPFKMVETQFCTPATQPHSKLHGFWAPAESFQGWKGIEFRGRPASKSFGDLRMLNVGWATPMAPVASRGSSLPGQAPIERLPIEILGSIINMLALDIPPNGISRRNVDLMSLLLASKTLHVATLDTLYSRITIPHSRIFHKFLVHIATHESLGTVVRRLDFCHFNPSQLFSTASERLQARNLTADTLLRCLELTPHLQEFLAQEYIDDELDARVLRKLFFGLPRLQAVDFCGCSSTAFKTAFSSILLSPWPAALSIRRLSLHKCLGLAPAVFETLLPRLPQLTHLDVAGTRVTDAALASIPPSARITHLNLARCGSLSADAVIDFLAHHPAVTRGSLVYLSLATDARSHQLLDVDDVTRLLRVLPASLRSLSLKGCKMDAALHLPLLAPLTKHLEELAVGRCLGLEDLNTLLVPPTGDDDDGDEDTDMDGAADGSSTWTPHTLRFLDVSDLWGSDLDLGYLFGKQCALLTGGAAPLTVVEVADDVARRLSKASPAALQRVGWRMSECGSRTWLVRNGSGDDDGRRPWKMGAESWGMRKVPVARAEVGGMYGSFMFARNL